MRRFLAASVISAFVASPALAAPINLDPGTGDPGGSGPGFTWQGLDFTLQNQPGPQISADHRVEGDSNGALNIILEEGASSAIAGNVGSAKVTYGANLTGQSSFTFGFQQLATETNVDCSNALVGFCNFANLQVFLRNNTGANNTVAQLLVGTDGGNPGSPFSGIQLRPENDSSFTTGEFIDNTNLSQDGQYKITSNEDGGVSADLSIDGRTLNVNGDISTLTDFGFDELLLQAETFLPDSDFQSTFASGQTMTFNSATVSAPSSFALAASSFAGFGLLMAWRRRKPAAAAGPSA